MFLTKSKMRSVDMVFLTSLPSFITIIPIFLGSEFFVLLNDSSFHVEEIFFLNLVLSVFVFFYFLSKNWKKKKKKNFCHKKKNFTQKKKKKLG